MCRLELRPGTMRRPRPRPAPRRRRGTRTRASAGATPPEPASRSRSSEWQSGRGPVGPGSMPACNSGVASPPPTRPDRRRVNVMSEISERFRDLAAKFTRRVDAVPDDRWSSPSPCEGWTTRDVVGHMVGNCSTLPRLDRPQGAARPGGRGRSPGRMGERPRRDPSRARRSRGRDRRVRRLHGQEHVRAGRRASSSSWT